MRDEHPFFKWRIELKEYDNHGHWFSRKLFYRDIAERILKIASLTVWDAYHLFYHGSSLAQGATYLEIGSDLGGSMLSVYYGTQTSGNSVNFIAIDYQITKQFLENTKTFPHLLIIPLISELAKDRIDRHSVDLLFIDGDHRYPSVKADIKNYWPKLKQGGILLGHDYYRFEDVRKAADKILGAEKITVLEHSDIWRVQK